MRNVIAAGIAATALAALSAQALGSTARTVRLDVPATVTSGQKFTVKAVGKAAGGAQLAVYFSNRRCASNAADESGSTRIINTHVRRAYSRAAMPTAQGSGQHYACGYLTVGGTTVARASKRYVVKASGPQILEFVVTPAPQQCTAAYVNLNIRDGELLKSVTVAFGDGHVFSPPGSIDSYTYQNLLQHGYVSPGSYTVALTVTDADGHTARASKTINDPGCPGATS
jgi:hypothetical protein